MQYELVDLEEDFDRAEEAERLFRKSKINYSRGEELFLGAINTQGKLIGAITFGLSSASEEPHFVFSVVVARDYRRKGIARMLVREVLSHGTSVAADYDLDPRWMIWVVNKNMVKLLESEGFEHEGYGEWSDFEPFLSRSYNNPKTSPWLKLEETEPFIPLMQRKHVAEVARSYRGFYTAFKKAKGQPSKLGFTHPDTPNRQPYPWTQRREEFIARHMAQVKKNHESLWLPDGNPTNRHLGLIAWAYSPDTARLKAWLRGRK